MNWKHGGKEHRIRENAFRDTVGINSRNAH
jgi:hypothetical protein